MFTIYKSDCLGQTNNCIYPHKIEVSDSASLAEAVSSDYVCAAYKNNWRSKANFLKSNCLAVEFDNDHSETEAEWVTPDSLMDTFTGVTLGIHFSRNHMKVKNGKTPRPKFHAFFQIEETTDADSYSELKRRVALVFPFVDPNALDAARFFFGTEDPMVEFHEGDRTLDAYFEEYDFITNMAKGPRVIKEGNRNSTLSRFAGKLVKRFGYNETSHGLFLAEAQKCEVPLPEDELASIWHSAGNFGKVVSAQEGYVEPEVYNAASFSGPPGSLKPEDYSDIGQAKVLFREYGGEIAFNPSTDFFQYDGIVWNESREAVMGSTMEFLDMQLADAEMLLFAKRQAVLNSGADSDALKGTKSVMAQLSDKQLTLLMEFLEAKTYHSFVLKRRDIKYIRSVMETIKPLCYVDIDALNQDPLLLNTPSATYRLSDGLEGRQEHEWKDYCTKVTAVDPGETGKDLWLDALDKTFLGDQELIDYVQEVVGLAAVGKVYKEAMIISYGEGRNGKSTFWNTVSRVLGSYSGSVSADTLTVGCRRNVKPEMAELKGVRLALARELEEGMRLNTSVVKQLTSTDAIYGEKKYCKPASFTPSHTLVLYTNHLPRVGATDEGTWRRLIVIPFNAVFEGSGDQKNYSDFLFENAGPAVLSWIIEGAQRVIKKEYHLTNPAVVQRAIDAYRSQNDWLSDFLEQCCEVDLSYREKSGELYQEYRSFCLRMGEFARNTAEFYGALSQREFERKKTRDGVIVCGLRLKTAFDG